MLQRVFKVIKYTSLIFRQLQPTIYYFKSKLKFILNSFKMKHLVKISIVFLFFLNFVTAQTSQERKIKNLLLGNRAVVVDKGEFNLQLDDIQYLTDGNETTKTLFRIASYGEPALYEFTLDMGAVSFVNYLKLKYETEDNQWFSMLVSAYDNYGNVVMSQSQKSATFDGIINVGRNVSKITVKFDVLNMYQQCNLYEIQAIYEEYNLTQNKPVSSKLNLINPKQKKENALDNNTTTYATLSNGKDSTNLVIDLEKNCHINRLEILSKQSVNGGIKIEALCVENNSQTWKEIQNNLSVVADNYYIVPQFLFESCIGKWKKIRITAPKKQWEVFEIQAYGSIVGSN